MHAAGGRILCLSEYFVLLRAGGIKSASDLAGRLLREAHVATVPGEGFGTREHIRVSYATSVTELDRGLERMRKFLGACRKDRHSLELGCFRVVIPHTPMSALYPFSMQPAFDPRPWGTLDLSPIYPNHKFDEKIGEAWLTGDAGKVANGPLKGKIALRTELGIWP